VALNRRHSFITKKVTIMNKLVTVRITTLVLVLGLAEHAISAPPPRAGRETVAPKRLNTQLPQKFWTPPRQSGPVAPRRSGAFEFSASASSNGKLRGEASYGRGNTKGTLSVEGSKKQDLAIQGKFERRTWSAETTVQPFARPKFEATVTKKWQLK
jgi:hypothetical protein